MSVLILTEVGISIGFGHFSRMIALNAFLDAAAVKVKTLLYVKGDFQLNHKLVEIHDWQQDDNFSELCSNFENVLIDSYLAKSKIYESLQSFFKKVIAIDDYNRIVYPVDIVINPNVFFDQIDYSNQSAKCYGGSDFVILRESFRKYEKPKTPQESGILITLGGSDYRNLLPQLCELSKVNKQITLICPEKEKLESIQEKYQWVRILGKLSESEILQEFVNAEIVISGCGQTLHELYHLRKKTVGICIDQDQIMNQEYYLNVKFLNRKIDWDSPTILNEIFETIVDLQEERFKPVFLNPINPIKNLENYISLFKE
ncbi:glycosyl transferase family 1 [Leptospira noguchii]|uniref:glycosyl transferase family 1 n=1 Tax=Leptospira noguchii TaxID=28182 RepID=UPI00034D2864|nr:glycosyl transferase family 1 [Leptospira noguchii]